MVTFRLVLHWGAPSIGSKNKNLIWIGHTILGCLMPWHAIDVITDLLFWAKCTLTIFGCFMFYIFMKSLIRLKLESDPNIPTEVEWWLRIRSIHTSVLIHKLITQLNWNIFPLNDEDYIRMRSEAYTFEVTCNL